jgi:hypothetical protein
MLSEVNVAFGSRKTFLQDLRRFVDRTPAIRALVWSQFPSRGQATLKRTMPTGNMNWQAYRDPYSRRLLRRIIRDAHGTMAPSRLVDAG